MTKFEEDNDRISDRELLATLLDAVDQLSDKEVIAFNKLMSMRKGLTREQRRTAERAYDRLGLDVDQAQNLVSSGKVAKGIYEPFPWEKNKPLKPPGK